MHVLRKFFIKTCMKRCSKHRIPNQQFTPEIMYIFKPAEGKKKIKTQRGIYELNLFYIYQSA